MIRAGRPWRPTTAALRARGSISASVLPVLLIAVGILCVGRLSAPSAAQNVPRPANVEQPSEPETEQRLREGATLDSALGRFTRTGGRLTFVTTDGLHRLVMLENLALERVIRLETDRLSSYWWVVTGEISEFQGNNFLLIRRATTRGRFDDPITPRALHGPPPALRPIGQEKTAR